MLGDPYRSRSEVLWSGWCSDVVESRETGLGEVSSFDPVWSRPSPTDVPPVRTGSSSFLQSHR